MTDPNSNQHRQDALCWLMTGRVLQAQQTKEELEGPGARGTELGAHPDLLSSHFHFFLALFTLSNNRGKGPLVTPNL